MSGDEIGVGADGCDGRLIEKRQSVTNNLAFGNFVAPARTRNEGTYQILDVISLTPAA